MNRNVFLFPLIPALSFLGACSSQPDAKQEKKAAIQLQKIQGRIQIGKPANATDAALNAGGPSVYLKDGIRQYRLFLKSPTEVVPDKEYVAEGVLAQKVIDEIGDPANGKGGYPLEASCQRAVRTAWTGLSFDSVDSFTGALRNIIKRYPARAVFLVTKLQPAEAKEGAALAEDDETPEIAVPSDKQSALLTAGPKTLPAPLWEPTGGTAKCKVLIGKDGKIAVLETGAQLCEAIPWSDFNYQPTMQKGKPVKVKTEVEVRFEPRT
ncbi:MAG: hypothetical protein HY820_43350 [Acidobacteria bacterium]|nr:hypothetical protein [Acidobacteriota bacterium]